MGQIFRRDTDMFPQLYLTGIPLCAETGKSRQFEIPLRGNREQFEKIRSSTPVGFYWIGSWYTVRSGRNTDSITFLLNDNTAEITHEGRGHIDVGSGYDSALQMNGKPLGKGGGNHHEGGNILAAHRSGNGDFAAGKLRAVDTERRTARSAEVLDAGTETPESIDEDTDGALVHAGGTVEFADAGAAGRKGSEKAHGSAGIAQVEAGAVQCGKHLLQATGIVAIG